MTVSSCGPWLTDRPDQAPPRKSATSHPGQQAPHATKGDPNRLCATPEQVPGRINAMHNAVFWAHS